jgi:hypothetical protein
MPTNCRSLFPRSVSQVFQLLSQCLDSLSADLGLLAALRQNSQSFRASLVRTPLKVCKLHRKRYFCLYRHCFLRLLAQGLMSYKNSTRQSLRFDVRFCLKLNISLQIHMLVYSTVALFATINLQQKKQHKQRRDKV